MKRPGTVEAGHRVKRPVFSRICRAPASRNKSALGAEYIDSGRAEKRASQAIYACPGGPPACEAGWPPTPRIRDHRLKRNTVTRVEGFASRTLNVNGVRIFARTGGPLDAPALLMRRGYPQKHVIWHRVVQALKGRLRCVLPDLRGHRDSSRPSGGAGHANDSKRTMALDHPPCGRRLALMDIVPTLDL